MKGGSNERGGGCNERVGGGGGVMKGRRSVGRTDDHLAWLS